MSEEKRTTTNIPVHMHQKVRLRAVIEGKSVQDMYEEILAKWIAELEERDRANEVSEVA
jgi:plasmid stability protein